MFEEKKVNKGDNFENYIERISNFSGEFEFGLFIYIAKKSIIWILLFLVLAYASAIIYLRYTQPVFESNSILQIQTNAEARKFLNIDNTEDKANLSHVVELLRSKVFLKRVLSNLPLQYSYFSEGTFIASELYTFSPYTVELKNVTTNLNNVKVYVDFMNIYGGVINYTIDNKNYSQKFSTERWIKTPHFNIKIHIKDYAAIKKQQSIVKSNSFYFIVNNIDQLVDEYYPNLNINILNADAGTILIKFSDLNPAKAAGIVSMMSTEYDSFEVEQKGGSSESVLDFINDQLDIAFERLKNAENSLSEFKEKYNIKEKYEGSGKQESAFEEQSKAINEIEDEIIDIDIENNHLTKIESIISNYKNVDTYTLISLLGEDSQHFGFIDSKKESKKFIFARENDVNQAKGINSIDLQKLLLQKEELLYSVKPENEAIKAIDFQIIIQLKILKENIKSIRNNNEIRKEELKTKLKTINGDDNSLPENALEYSRLQRSFSINEQYYILLIEKKTEYSISKASFVSQNIVLQKGVIPTEPISPKTTSVYIICFMLATIFSIAIIVVRYLAHDQINSLNEISNHLKSSIPILGIVPKSPTEIPSSQLLVDKNPKSLIAEAFRSIRSNMQFISSEEGAKVIAITSTISGEGKTFVSINLAGILAFSGKKVVLIDLDMRKPKIHLGFKTENTKGMSTLLIGKNSLEECIQHSELENLDFITAGPIPPNPSELVISKKMEELLKLLKSIYDIIVIDTPPIGIVSDGISMIQKADYPIYIFRADYSKRSFIHNIDRLYNEGKMHKLCIVLNGVDAQRQVYGYNYGYGYGYGYGSNYGYYDDTQSTKKRKFLFRNK